MQVYNNIPKTKIQSSFCPYEDMSRHLTPIRFSYVSKFSIDKLRVYKKTQKYYDFKVRQ